MDNVTPEQEVVKILLTPPVRRRSSLFEKIASSITLPNHDENIDPKPNELLTDFKKNDTPELQRYYDKLLAEKELWKNEVNRRREKYHDLKEIYQINASASSSSRICYSSLSNEDVKFLNGKVSAKNLVDSQKKLHESLQETHALFKRGMELDDVLLSNSKDKLEKLKEHFLNNSTV